MGVTRRRAYCDTVALFTLPSVLPLPSGLVCNTNHFNKNPITSTGFNALLLSNLYFGEHAASPIRPVTFLLSPPNSPNPDDR